MPFNLPSPQSLHTAASTNNVGTLGTVTSLGTKSGGNLPISTNASQCINNTPSNTTGVAAGVFFGINGQTATSTVDVTSETRVLVWSLQYNAPNRIQSSDFANGGSRFRLGSGPSPTQNYRDFFIGGNDTPFCASQAGPVTICIDLSASNNQLEVGSFDPAQVSAYGHASVRRNLVGSSTTQTFFQRSFLFTTTKGSSNIPNFTGSSNFDDAVSLVQGSGYTTKIGAWLTKSGSSFFVPCPLSFGDGASAVSFDDQGVSVVSPGDNVPNQENFRLTNNAMRVYLDTRDNAADSVILRGSYAWGTAAPWDFSQSNQGTCTLSGNFGGMGDFTIGSSVTSSGVFSLASGSKLIVDGASIDSTTVNGDLELISVASTAPSPIWDSSAVWDSSAIWSVAGGQVISNVTVTGAFNFDTPGTYTFSNCNVAEVTNSSGGSVTINNAGSTIGTNTGPNITIAQPPALLTLNGLQPNTEVRVYQAGTITEVAGVENSGTSFSAFIAIPSVDVVIFNVQYLPIKLESVDTTINTTLPIQQQFDRNFENP